jgi:transposase InsO family protein
LVPRYTPDGNRSVVDVQYPSSDLVPYAYDSEYRVVRVADPARGLTFATAITYRHPDAVEYAPLVWVDWFNTRRLLEPLGHVPPAEYEARYYEQAKVA